MESFWAPTVFREGSDASPRQVKFESNRVHDLLKALGMADCALELINLYECHWGIRRLTFEGFHDMVRHFPYMLEGQSFFKTMPSEDSYGWMGLGKWMTGFTGTFIAKRYLDLLDRYATFSDRKRRRLATPVPSWQQGLPLAMCFPWAGIKKGLIIHNAKKALTDTFFSTLLHRQDGPLRIYVERYASWLAALAKSNWSSSGNEEDDLPDAGSGFSLSPSILAACGHDARDAWLLLWLLRVAGHDAGPQERRLIVRVAGERYVSATLDQFANATGLTVQQVRDATAALVARGFVVRPENTTGLRRRTTLRVIRSALRRAIPSEAAAEIDI